MLICRNAEGVHGKKKVGNPCIIATHYNPATQSKTPINKCNTAVYIKYLQATPPKMDYDPTRVATTSLKTTGINEGRCPDYYCFKLNQPSILVKQTCSTDTSDYCISGVL